LSKSYSYDSAYRLIGSVVTPSTGPSDNTSYTLDGVGNRKTVVENGNTTAYAMTASAPDPEDGVMNQYTSIGSNSRQYDKNSNLRQLSLNQSSAIALAYDYKNRLVGVTNNALGLATIYAYDALNRRVQKVVSPTGVASSTNLFYYCDWQEIEERDGTGQTAATFVYGLQVDELLMAKRSGGAIYFHEDDQYNVRAISDSTGAVTERYEYGDFGQPSFYSPSGVPITASAVANPFLFNGHRYDPESGFYSYRNRYLEPTSGRFLNRDTIGIWGDEANMGNAFCYVANNPATMLDPYGTDCCAQAKAAGMYAKGSWGGVICCSGVKMPCYFGPSPTTLLNYIAETVVKCTIEHETDHIPRQQECNPGCKGDGAARRVERRDDISQHEDECKAWTVSLTCFSKARKATCEKLKGKDKQECEDQFKKMVSEAKEGANGRYQCGFK